jgi:hypothetical protein
VDLNDAATSHALDAALKLFRGERAALAKLNRKDNIQGFFGLRDLGREVPDK